MSESPSVRDEERIDKDLSCHACGYNLRTLLPTQTCPECGAEVAVSIRLEELRRTRPAFILDGFSVPARLIHLLLGVILPFFPFFLGELSHSSGLTTWQSGQWNDYVGMLLGGVPSRPFYPLLMYAILAMLAMLIKPAQNGRKTWVVVGMIVGVVLSLQYSLILFGAGGAAALVWSFFIIPFAIVPGSILYFYSSPSQSENNREPWTCQHKWVVTIIIGAVVVMLTIGTGGIPIAILLGFSPLFCLMIYTLTLARILRTHRLRPTSDNNLLKTIIPSSLWLWLSGGLAAFFLAWIAAIKLAMIEYAKLPTQPSHCYIATAAANGHTRLVGSEPVTLSSGQTIRVNQQMRVLKAAEIALRTTSPRTHRACRAIYNRLGPVLANRINNPILADLAYLTLAPFAFLATAILKPLIPDFHNHIARFYRDGLSHK